MRVKSVFSCIILAFCSVPLWAGNGAEIIYRTGKEYQSAEFSAIASGKNIATSQHAQTRREFKNRVLNDDSKDDELTTSANLTLAPFVGVYYSPYNSKDRLMPTHLIYLYDKIPDAVNFTAGFGIKDSFYAKLVYTASCSKEALADGKGVLHPASAEYYESGDSPKEGYMSFASDHFSVALGRFKSGSGNGIMGNLFQNSLAPYYDQFTFSFYSKRVKYYYMLGMSSSYLTKEEKLYLDGDASISPPAPPAIDYQYQPLKMFAFHRIEIAPADTLTIGIGEMTLVGGKVPDMNMVNPFGIYHNIYESVYNSYYAAIDISWVPAKGHFIFAEVVANEIYVKGESNKDPTAMGQQIGYWFILPFDTVTKHRVALELTRIDGWTYSDLAPYVTMYQRQTQREVKFDVPLGYSLGGDLQQASLIYTAVSKDGIKLNLALSYLRKGEIDFRLKNPGELDAYMPYTQRRDKKYIPGPTGTIEKWSSADLLLDLPITERIAINTLAYYAYIQNFGHESGKTKHLAFLSLGISIIAF
ncbi:MAG: hypothetical protein FWG13_00125 [Leptospirales bacterium]|nr:hypothetical protein [Leptospirales bacterium]